MKNIHTNIGKIFYRDYRTRVIMASILADVIKDPELSHEMIFLDTEMNQLSRFIEGEIDYIGVKLNLNGGQ